MTCGDSLTVELPLFQGEDGGANPTSPLQLLFREIKPITAAIAYSRWHYLGETDFISQINFGAYWNGKLEGAISYGPPNAKVLKGFYDEETQSGWYEIKRLCMSPICPRNSESCFIGKTIKMLKKIVPVKGIVTYADDGQGHVGTIYKATNFKYVGLTAAKKDYVCNGKKIQRGKTTHLNGEWVERSRKHLFVMDFRK